MGKKSFLSLLDANAPQKVLFSSFPGRSAYAIQVMSCTPRWNLSWEGPPKPRCWTAAEETLLKESVAQGHSLQYLTRALNRAHKSVSKKASLLGLSFRRDICTPKEEEDVMRWSDEGAGPRLIISRICSSLTEVLYNSEVCMKHNLPVIPRTSRQMQVTH